MVRPFTRAQALQNRRFLSELARTGNARDAARTLGVNRSTFTKRRAKHPGFAAEWDAALATASATLDCALWTGRHDDSGPHRVRRSNGQLQVRRKQAGRLTRDVEQAFLTALAATANVRLSAAAAGLSHTAFYHRKASSPAFAREWRLALAQGYERLEMALLESMSVDSHDHDDWRHNEPPAMPPMTANQALQLMYLHQKEARLLAEPAHLKRRRGESREAHSYRLSVMYELGQARDREAFALAEAARRERGEPGYWEERPALPDLAQVSGWSGAKGEEDPAQDRALFGGWRLGDGEEEEED